MGILRSDKNWLAKTSLQKEIEKAAAMYVQGKLLDVGCGKKPYYNILAPFVDKYVGLDHFDTTHSKEHVDILGDALNLPFNDNSFDTVFSTEVLEHIEEPRKMLEELCRVLLPGGKCVLTTPFIWPMHEEPRDFYRYTEHGLKYLFESSGFDIIYIKPLGGFWLTSGQMVINFMWAKKKWFGGNRALRILTILFNTIFYPLEKKFFVNYLPWNHIVVAKKKIPAVEEK